MSTVEFPCKKCHQLLQIASNLVGSEIACPECSDQQVVPTQEEAVELLRRSQVIVGSEIVSHHYRDVMAGSPVPSGKILFSRNVFYWQFALTLLLATGVGILGYFLGRGDATYDAKQEHLEKLTTRATISNSVDYLDHLGVSHPDGGAVAFYLPNFQEDQMPKGWKKINSFELRPEDAAPPKSHSGRKQLEKFGGFIKRVNTEGQIKGTLEKKGYWYLFVISRNSQRPEGEDFPSSDIDLLDKYFTDFRYLIGSSRYQIVPVSVTNHYNGTNIVFPEPGKPSFPDE